MKHNQSEIALVDRGASEGWIGSSPVPSTNHCGSLNAAGRSPEGCPGLQSCIVTLCRIRGRMSRRGFGAAAGRQRGLQRCPDEAARQSTCEDGGRMDGAPCPTRGSQSVHAGGQRATQGGSIARHGARTPGEGATTERVFLRKQGKRPLSLAIA